MTPDRLFLAIQNFYHGYPYLTIGLAAGFALILFLRPKQVAKTLLTLAVLAVAAYLLYLLGTALLTGIAGKEQMIHK